MATNLCNKCVAECRHEIEPDEIVVMCGSFKERITNADRIRAMSDEELAEQLSIEVFGLAECTLYFSAPTGRLYISNQEAVGVTLDWLRQPAEEG